MALLRKGDGRPVDTVHAKAAAKFVGGGSDEGSRESNRTSEEGRVETATEWSERKRNMHRFMDDLEERVARPDEPVVLPTPISASSPIDGDGNAHNRGENITTPASWLWKSLSAAKSNLQQQSNGKNRPETKPAPLLSREKQRKARQQQAPENFDVVVSSSAAVLADDELRQLQELQSSSRSSTSIAGKLLALSREHPREAFIVLTLVLCVVAYFYSRGAYVEEDVR